MDELAIFTRALDIECPSERAAFLEQACGSDAALRARVEALLQSHQAAGSFLQGSPPGKSSTRFLRSCRPVPRPCLSGPSLPVSPEPTVTDLK